MARRLLPTAAEYVRCYILYGNVNQISKPAGFRYLCAGKGENPHAGQTSNLALPAHLRREIKDMTMNCSMHGAGLGTIGGSMAGFGRRSCLVGSRAR